MEIETELRDYIMSDKFDGLFSASLFSLQLQIKTLLEGAGGDDALALLDALCTLNKSEQRVALKLFRRCIDRIAEGSERLETAEDKALKEFEDGLYNEIVNSMHNAARSDGNAARKFEVLDGGKDEKSANPTRSTPIDFAKARKAKQNRTPPLLN